MKILIDARFYGLEHTGIGRYIMSLLDELKKFDTKNEYVIFLRKKYFNGLNFPANWKKVLADFGYYSFDEQLKLPGLIKKHSPDLVHFPHINIPIFYNGAYVVTVHDMTMHNQGTDATTLPLYKYFFKRIPYKLAVRRGVLKAKKVITPSDAVKQEIINYFRVDPSKVVVTHEGLSKSFARDETDKGESEILSDYGLQSGQYFFYVGNAFPHKYLKLAIQAIKKLNDEENSKMAFAIAGSKNVFVKRLEDLIKRENAAAHIKLLGYVREEDLPVLYKNSVCFIYPSLSEGFGLQGLEAIGSDSLVLASNIPVFKEIYGSNALYFDPMNVESLIKAMKDVMKMSHQEKCRRISSAKDYIKKYSWPKMAKETLEVYNSITA